MRRFLSYFIAAYFIFCGASLVKAGQISLAPDFTLEDTAGQSVTLADYRDKRPAILFFWTTWCPFCRRELEQLNGIYPQLKKEGMELLVINVGEAGYRVDNFLKRYSPAFRVFLDRDQRVAYDYGVLGVPAYVLVDKNGRIAYTGSSFPQEEYQELLRQ